MILGETLEDKSMAGHGKVENLTHYKPRGEKALSKRQIALRLPPEIDEWLRSQPNHTELLRSWVKEKYDEAHS